MNNAETNSESTSPGLTVSITGQITLDRRAIAELLQGVVQAQGQPASQTAALPRIEGTEVPLRLAYTMKETAELLGVSYMTVHRFLQRGLLRSSLTLRIKVISRKEIERFLQSTSSG